ncbi:MAG TPA: vanadium-dependent haloperoxidase [Chitinophagaceae bacterium]
MKRRVKPLTNSTLILCCLLFIVACKKERADDAFQAGAETASEANSTSGHLKQTKTYSSEVAQKWHDLQLRILRLPAGANPYGLNGNRNFAYCGIALYESVVPGMPSYQSLYGQLTDMPAMPETEPGKAYHWPTCANTALASLSKNLFATAPAALKISMDSLEAALNAEYSNELKPETFQRSVDFGKTVAQRIFDWSKTDGSLTAYPPYQPPPGVGIWSNTAPNPTAVFAPYWGKNRLFVPGSMNNTESPAPPVYSTDPNSDYYKMVKEVYDISQSLTPAQIATALYFRDNPGFQAGTHYQSVFSQVMHAENPQLDFYALAQAQTGIALAESQIACWKVKYETLMERPIRYIRNVLGHNMWNPVLATPPHPDFPSGHSQTGGAFAGVFTNLFGDNYQITLHTYDNLGMAPRSYNSFMEMVDDIGKSRVYAGIHYTYSCTEGSKKGVKIAENILGSLRFRK